MKLPKQSSSQAVVAETVVTARVTKVGEASTYEVEDPP
jgi:hypothetical protein